MKSLITTILLLFYLCGCKEQTSDSQFFSVKDTVIASTKVNIKDKIQTYKDSICGIQSFEIDKDSIDGCNDAFFADSVMMLEHQYLFVSNFNEKSAIINIYGKKMYLSLDTTVSYGSNEIYSKAFKGNGYTVIFSVRMIQKYDEGGLYKGVLDISHEGKSTIIDIIGESGC